MKPKTLLPDRNKRVPAPDGPFYHYMPVQVRISDIDFLGHVNNAVYMNYFDMGKGRYFEEAMSGNLDWSDVGVVIVNINCTFYSPILFDEPVEVLTKVTAVGHRSFNMEQRIINSDTHQTKAIALTILSGFSRSTMKSVEIASSWIEALERMEQRPLTKE